MDGLEPTGRVSSPVRRSCRCIFQRQEPRHQAGEARGDTRALEKLEAATTSLTAAEKALSLAGLTAIKATTDAVDLIITELYGKGGDTEAKLLGITNRGGKDTYDVAAISDNTGGSPNVDETLKASEQALADGTAYQESASASPLAAVGSVLPIVIVIVVSVLVVVGAIIFIRRRRGGWDELG